MYEIDEKCRECVNNGKAICNRCDMFYDQFEPINKPPITNYVSIINKTPEELAEWLSCNCVGDGYGNSTEDWLDWLRQEALP